MIFKPTTATSEALSLVGAMLLSLCLAIPVRASIDSDEPRDGYPSEYHDKAYNIVVGRVISIALNNPDKYQRVQLKVAAAMGDGIKQETTISIRGQYMGGISAGGFSLNVSVGQMVVLLVKSTGEADQFDCVVESIFPFGAIRPDRPAIPPGDVPLIAAALKEMARNLAAPDGAGMPRDRARSLLKNTNPYLRALACWRLLHGLDETSDMSNIKQLFDDPSIAPSEALFLDELLSHVTGPAEASAPTQSERLVLLRRVLINQSNARIEEATKSAATTKP